MRAIWLVLVVPLCSGCDQRQGEDVHAPMAVPEGWQVVTPLPAGGGRPQTTVAVPTDLRRTGEVGVDSPSVTYAKHDLLVRFDYGAAAHPGCVGQTSRCTFRDTRIAGRLARSSTSPAPVEDRPFATVHSYFVSFGEEENLRGNSSDNGQGLLITVKCRESPVCGVADTIASTVRLDDAS